MTCATCFIAGNLLPGLTSCHPDASSIPIPKIESRNLHGTGCTLSSAIATFLAGGNKLDEAVCKAKEYIGTAINRGKDMNIGHGNGPLWHFPLSE